MQREILIAACRRLRILSTLPFGKVPIWNQCVTTLAAKDGRIQRVLELLRQAPGHDLVLITGGERVDLFYLALAALCPWIHTPHVIVDAHWQKGKGIQHTLQRLLLRVGRRLTAQVQPHSVEEEKIYNQLFGIPRDKLRAIPWSTSLTGHDVAPARADEEGDFVLTGGFSFRDYGPLFEAIAGADLMLRVGVPAGLRTSALEEQWKGVPSIEFHTGWSNAQFIRQMAGCRFFVMPIAEGLTRSTADQTILNAMYFGKIVIATNSIGPRIYIRNGVSGFLVPHNTPDAWRTAINDVLNLSEAERQRISRAAQQAARVEFGEEQRLFRTLAAAIDVARH